MAHTAKTLYVYGDSIMKATAPDAQSKYHFHISDYLAQFSSLPLQIVNRARFGATVHKGQRILERDLAGNFDGQYALIEYGGNDCDFDWDAIAADPSANHQPKTALPQFVDTLKTILAKLRGAGCKPILMTLPPIDAERYLHFVSKQDENRRRTILQWLGDTNMIYRFQELYSNTIKTLANETGTFCIDLRAKLLPDHNFHRLISSDGIHPSLAGYDRIFGLLKQEAECRLLA